jgi:DNA-binding transcriptional ArsR family regulator
VSHRKSASLLKAEILAALAHPNRIRIVEYLKRDVRCNCELAQALQLEQSNLSRHLKQLVQAGILVSWKEGLRVNLKVADERIFTILDMAAGLAQQHIVSSAQALQQGSHEGEQR